MFEHPILIVIMVLYPIVLIITIQMAREIRKDDSINKFFKILLYFVCYTPLNVALISVLLLMIPFIDPITESIEKKRKLKKIKKIKRVYNILDPYGEEDWEE